MRRFPRLRRLAALLSGALLLQLSLLGSAAPCPMHGAHRTDTAAPHRSHAASIGHNAHGSHARHAAAGHAAEVAGAATLPAAVAAPDPGAPACDGGGPQGMCGSPSAPGRCATMSGCAGLTISAPAGAGVAATVAHAARELPVSTGMPLGPAYAPELPPPRA